MKHLYICCAISIVFTVANPLYAMKSDENLPVVCDGDGLGEELLRIDLEGGLVDKRIRFRKICFGEENVFGDSLAALGGEDGAVYLCRYVPLSDDCYAFRQLATFRPFEDCEPLLYMSFSRRPWLPPYRHMSPAFIAGFEMGSMPLEDINREPLGKCDRYLLEICDSHLYVENGQGLERVLDLKDFNIIRVADFFDKRISVFADRDRRRIRICWWEPLGHRNPIPLFEHCAPHGKVITATAASYSSCDEKCLLAIAYRNRSDDPNIEGDVSASFLSVDLQPLCDVKDEAEDMFEQAFAISEAFIRDSGRRGVKIRDLAYRKHPIERIVLFTERQEAELCFGHEDLEIVSLTVL